MTSLRKSSPNEKIQQQTEHDGAVERTIIKHRKLITMAHVLTP